MSKLKINKLPEIPEGKTDILLIILGVAVIGYALYLGGVFNGAGKVIDASDRFRKTDSNTNNTIEQPSEPNQ